MQLFYILLIVQHLSIFILVTDQLDAQNLFCNKFISSLYMFRAPCANRQEVKIVLYCLWYHHTYRCDDTRDCIIQFLPSWRLAHGARNMYRLEINLLENKFCASSWSVTKIIMQLCYSDYHSKYLQPSQCTIMRISKGNCEGLVFARAGKKAQKLFVSPDNRTVSWKSVLKHQNSRREITFVIRCMLIQHFLLTVAHILHPEFWLT